MHKDLNEYKIQNKTLRIDFIKKVLESDFYYQPSRAGGLGEIAIHAEKIIDKIFEHNKSNPIITSWGDRAYFDPDEENTLRDGRLIAITKYATHFVTTKNQASGFRNYDRSKIQYIDIFFDIISNADWKLTTRSDYGYITYNYAWKSKPNLSHILVGRVENEEDKSCCRIVGFLAEVNDKRLHKKIASALKAEAKTTRTD